MNRLLRFQMLHFIGRKENKVFAFGLLNEITWRKRDRQTQLCH